MHRITVAVLVAAAALAFASPAPAASGKAAALKRDLGGGVRVSEHRGTGLVRFLGTPAGRPIARPSGVRASAPPAKVARAFLGAHGRAFGIRDQATELRATGTSKRGGRSSVRFQQIKDGIPVLGGELVTSVDSEGNVLAVSGETLKDAAPSTPQVTSAAARATAIAAVARRHGISAVRLDATLPERWIYDARLLGGPGPRTPTLTWRVEVKGESGLAVNELILVDAKTGGVALRIDQIHEALNRTVCDANNTGGSGGSYPCTNPVATEADPPAAGDDADVAPAFEFAGDTYYFYKDRFGRDSLDGQGLTLRSTVDYCHPSLPCPMANAFWDGSQMAYGNGFAGADDVVGHELTHGVTTFTSNLNYYFQSGAINESLSDVFGEFVDLTNGAGTDTAATRWQLGEDLPASIGVIRDMQNPPLFDQPDRMTSSLYTADLGEGDSCVVQPNSGVNNKAAYLMTDGDSFNGRTVTGMGITKVARIYYEVETAFLTSGSDYADLASALPQACTDLIGTAGITAADCTEVGDAVAAVEMSAQPTSDDAAAPEAPATCAGGQVRQNLFLDNMESSSNWTRSSTTRWSFGTGYAHSGVRSLNGADPSTTVDTNATMTNPVVLPAAATAVFLRFDHAYDFDEDATGSYDGGVVEVSVDGGAFQDINAGGLRLTDVGYDGPISPSSNALAGRQAFVGRSNGYRASRANLTSFKGHSVRVRFRIGTDNVVGGDGWFIDDVNLYTCTTPPPPPDSDGDGVPDAGDACPATPGTEPNGCPPSQGIAPPPGTGTGGGSGSGGTTGGGAPDAGSSVNLASAKVRSCKRSGRGRKARVRCVLRDFGAVARATVTAKRNGRTVARKTLKPSAAGVLLVKPKRPPLRKGLYKVTIVVRDATGAKRTLKKRFRVR